MNRIFIAGFHRMTIAGFSKPGFQKGGLEKKMKI